jgi:hypothetical protein
MTAEIMQVLVTSTAHMTYEESQKIEAGEPPGNLPSPLTWQYGYIFYIGGPRDATMIPEELSAGLYGAIQQAWAHNCEWIRFDCDAAKLEGVEEYNWEAEIAAMNVVAVAADADDAAEPSVHPNDDMDTVINGYKVELEFHLDGKEQRSQCHITYGDYHGSLELLMGTGHLDNSDGQELYVPAHDIEAIQTWAEQNGY